MLSTITSWIVKIITALCILVITGLTVIVFVQVFSRFIKYSLPGTEELARLLVIWLTFLGTSLAIHERMHLGVRYFVGLANEKFQKVIDRIIYAVTIGMFAVIAVYGFKLTMATMSTTSSTLQLPMGLFYIVIPISAIFSIYFIILNIIEPDPSNQGEASL
ncbi:TRAP transporter small permease [Sporosarcina sp. PTS2304]|uniref:TRAP transporter small permease n=1 Tax=Sporosarcina sp. PTS2304 TaxID=2283194 RepID=UPI000E0D7B8C|nr:TRAP transporter small permease [Sporosarcina sp. PTS2304]AXI00196.1 TRAP transporter small permease [Sporosarcina sp. PTS2304]